jgi:hypothetical protein
VTLKGSTEATVNQPLSMQLAEKHAAQRSVKRTRKQMRKVAAKGAKESGPVMSLTPSAMYERCAKDTSITCNE